MTNHKYDSLKEAAKPCEASQPNYEAECRRLLDENFKTEMKYEDLLAKYKTLQKKCAALQGFAAAVEIIFGGSLYKNFDEYGGDDIE